MYSTYTVFVGDTVHLFVQVSAAAGSRVGSAPRADPDDARRGGGGGDINTHTIITVCVTPVLSGG
jgi:hypothetical protein